MTAKKKVVQGCYISIEAKHAFLREAYRQKTYTTRIVSEILEKAALKIIKKERIYEDIKRED
jgi:hypothetical protein